VCGATRARRAMLRPCRALNACVWPLKLTVRRLKVESFMASRFLSAAVGAFVLFSLSWILWGLATPGDFFGNRSAFVNPTLGAAALVGLGLGFKAVGRWRQVIYACGLVSACFWVAVPSGWWARGP
jgi:hypothetical protein